LSALRRAWQRLLGAAGRRGSDDDLRAEIESHLEMQVEDNLRLGLSPSEARRQALLKFGGVEAVKEAYRDQRGLPLFDDLAHDFRYAWRMLLKTRGATAAAVIAFALGLGGNAAMYSICDVLLFRPLLLPDLDHLVVVPTAVNGASRGVDDVAPADFLDLKARVTSVEGLSAVQWWDVNVTGAGEPAQVLGFRVSAPFFDTLRARPLLGRTFAAGEDVPGHDGVVVLSHGFWQRQFAADPGVVGRRIRLNGREHDVIGVMPADVRYPPEAELWAPLAWSPADREDRVHFYLTVVGRLRDGTSLAAARSEIDTIGRQLAADHADTHAGRAMGVALLRENVSGDLTRDFSLLMMGVVAFVLLIACANVANLQFARVATRGREMAVRAALGAGRWRLVRQLVAEGVLLGLLGAAASVVFALWAVDVTHGSMPPEVQTHLPGWHRMRLNAHALAYTLVLAVASGLIAGLAAAWASGRGELADALRDGARGTSASRHRLKGSLVVCQLVLALVLLVGAGLMVRGFRTIANPLPGGAPEQVLVFRLTLSESRHPGHAERAAFADRALDRLRALPDVQDVGLTSTLPYSGHGGSTPLEVEGRPVPPGPRASTRYQPTSPGLFAALRIPVRGGRDFGPADGAGAPPVAIVNETFVRRYLPGGEPIGRRVRVGTDGQAPWLTVVGVVADVLHDWTDRAPRPTLFRPYAQGPQRSFFVAARTRRPPAEAVPAVRAALRSIDPEQPLARVTPYSKMISDYLAGLAYVAAMMGVFGLIALSLAVIGVYSVMSYYVTERTREIGIRVALGATLSDVVRLVVGRGAALAGTGLVIGLGAAVLVARGLESVLYGVRAHDFMALGGVSLLLGGAALAACAIPAARAARVDPLTCLRADG
jgi:putative ABC transport system permease protein